jgi:hypothetical protein
LRISFASTMTDLDFPLQPYLVTSKTCTEHVVCFPCPYLFNIRTYSYMFFPFPLALSIFLVEAAEEVFEIIAGLFLFLVCNLGQ